MVQGSLWAEACKGRQALGWRIKWNALTLGGSMIPLILTLWACGDKAEDTGTEEKTEETTEEESEDTAQDTAAEEGEDTASEMDTGA